MTIEAEFIGEPTVLRCFIIISVCKYLQANLAILFEMTGLKVDKKSSWRAFSTGKSNSCFRWMDKRKIMSFLFLFFFFFDETDVTLLTRDKTQLNIQDHYLSTGSFFGRIQKRICGLRSYEFLALLNIF